MKAAATPYNAGVRGEPRNVALGMLLALLLLTFYPALMLGRRVAPESSLRSVPPWRHEWGPSPDPPPRVLAAATQLGPRLAVIAREGVAAALWDPWIGGGRAGWLSAPREGGAPLPVLAALLARPQWVWTALLALTVTASFTAAWVAARWIGASGWGAAVGAMAYTLAGPVAWHWFDWRGSAVALGPLALLPALSNTTGWGRRAAAWTLALSAVVLAGTPAIPFIAMALAHEFLGRDRRLSLPRCSAVAAALLLVMMVRLPIAWLASAATEPGARAAPARPASPLPGLRSLVSRDESGLLAAKATTNAGAAAPETASEPGLLGATTLLLAALGVVAAGGRDRRFWGAVILVSLALSLAPTSWLASAGLAQRPLAVLAFAAALLAARGVDSLTRRLAPGWIPAAGVALCALVVLELAPVALHEVPFATERDAQLQLPVPEPLPDDGLRVLAMMAALPPDAAASFGIADVRATWFDREPAYENLVRGGRSGASDVLDPVYAQLGARWILEPVPLRVVSGLLFGDIDVVEAPRISGGDATTARYRLAVPEGACRLGLPRLPTGDGAVFLQGAEVTTALEEDRALAEESLDWRWVSVRRGAPRGDVVLGVIGVSRAPASLSVAVDVSGVRLATDDQGMRVWDSEHAERFARVEPAAPSASADVTAMSESRVEIAVHASQASNLVVQVKHRPRLWRATVNGRPAATTAARDVWTAVPVPPGDSHVVLRAAIPTAVWGASAAAVIMTALLGLYRRST